ncbi:MAG: hypothetical protein JO316_23205 [Abitibacteriaceae bacterium]|nr:hypothetical protein [Abditibacteriaceae bacterium]MBV9868273.1 hypothetical protein [Abditibacteriaceae bacterium]
MRLKTLTGCGIWALIGIFSPQANHADEMQSLPPAPSSSATPVTPTTQSTIEKIITDVPPYTDKAVAMAPMRPLCAFLGAHVEYSDGIITLTKSFGQTPPGTRIITIRTGGGVAQVQDTTGRHTVRLSLPAEERLNVVFVPLRFIVQVLGGSVDRIPEGEITVIRVGERAGILTPIAQEGYRGPDAARLTIMNQVGRALSLRLVGPQHVSVELGRNSTITRSVRPGVYAYRAASTGMKPMSGTRRLLAGRKAIWAWGHR